jgi:hypothetical protein
VRFRRSSVATIAYRRHDGMKLLIAVNSSSCILPVPQSGDGMVSVLRKKSLQQACQPLS